MAKEPLKPIDISNIPELLRLAEEVHATNEARLLRRDDEDLAVVRPVVSKRRAKRRSTKADREAFLSAAGSWKGLIDAEAFKAEIRASRGSDRPTVTL